MDISTAVTNIHDKANDYVKTLDSAIKNLEEAIKYLNNAKTKLSGSVATAKTNWNNIANDNAISDTSLAKQDKAEIDQLDTYLNEANIQKLVTRLENIKADLTTVRDQVKEYKFAGKFIGDIEGYSGDAGLGSMKHKLQSIDEHLRTQIRVIIWKQWKVSNKRLWGLLKLGVPNWLAHKVANWGDHYQFVATKSVLARAVSKEKLTERGVVSFSDYYLK